MKIAVCGGIGSGKSAVIECIDELGYSTRKADDINAELFYDEKYLRLLLAAFPDIQLPDGSVDKVELRRQIFKDKAKRYILNSISHPLIKKRIEEMQQDPLFVEVPLLIEANMRDCFDEVIFVKSSKRKRLARLASRPGLSAGMALKIMKSQKSDKELMAVSTIVLDNNGTKEDLKRNVKEICDYIFGTDNKNETE